MKLSCILFVWSFVPTLEGLASAPYAYILGGEVVSVQSSFWIQHFVSVLDTPVPRNRKNTLEPLARISYKLPRVLADGRENNVWRPLACNVVPAPHNGIRRDPVRASATDIVAPVFDSVVNTGFSNVGSHLSIFGVRSQGLYIKKLTAFSRIWRLSFTTIQTSLHRLP